MGTLSFILLPSQRVSSLEGKNWLTTSEETSLWKEKQKFPCVKVWENLEVEINSIKKLY